MRLAHLRCLLSCLGAAALLLVSIARSSAWGGDAVPTFRFRLAVSAGMMGPGVNEGDARLAMQAWRDAVVRQSGFLVDFHVSTLPNLVRELRDHQLDGFTLTTLEFLDVQNYAGPSLLMDESYLSGGDEYLLLVNEDSNLRTLADLRHKSLNVYDNPRMCLAANWLQSLLASSKLGTSEEFFGRPSSLSKLSKVVLPVYFRQIDACLVTRRGFSTMCELNPQLGRKLRVLASSPKLITTFMAFHKDTPTSARQRCEAALVGLHKSVAGQQALTLFESSRLVLTDISALRTTLDLVKTHDRARGNSAGRN
jgi:phosphonate transport system substrate-binding protein